MSVFKVLRRLDRVTAPAPSSAHDWDVLLADIEAEHEVFEPAATTPAADAEAVETGGPPDLSPASALSFADYVVPAITDVLAEHQFHLVLDQCGCGEYMDDYDWREHVAEFLAERIETCLLNRFPK